MNVNELFSAGSIAAYHQAAAGSATPYVGAALFPAAKKAGLDLEWFIGFGGMPVSLAPAVFDAKAKLRERVIPVGIETEMPFFREGFLLKERDRQEILRAQDSNDPYVQEILARTFDDASDLIEGAEVAVERMRMQLLAYGTINIESNGVLYEYNYDPNGTFRDNNYVAAPVSWSDPAADILVDLQTAMDHTEETSGTRPAIAIMSRKTFGYLLKNTGVRSAVLAQNQTANVFMSEAVVKQALVDLLGLTVIVYNKKYKNEDGETQQFYPDDMCTLLPEGNLGKTWYGTTPEEADLLGGATNVQVKIVNTGVAVTTKVMDDPVNIKTIASEIVLPSWERMNECCIINTNKST